MRRRAPRRSGFRAQYPDVCRRCPRPINVGDRIVRHHDGVIHVGCASGHDDE